VALNAFVTLSGRSCADVTLRNYSFTHCSWGRCGARGHCRISPPCFLANCHKRRLNQGSFVSAVCLVVYFFWFVSCLYVYFFVIYIELFLYCLFVTNSQVIGCEDRLQNDIYCVGWGVKPYSVQSKLTVSEHVVELTIQSAELTAHVCKHDCLQVVLEKQSVHTWCILSPSCRFDRGRRSDVSRSSVRQLRQSTLFTDLIDTDLSIDQILSHRQHTTVHRVGVIVWHTLYHVNPTYLPRHFLLHVLWYNKICLLMAQKRQKICKI